MKIDSSTRTEKNDNLSKKEEGKGTVIKTKNLEAHWNKEGAIVIRSNNVRSETLITTAKG